MFTRFSVLPLVCAAMLLIPNPAAAFEFKGFMDVGYQGSGSRRANPALKNGSFLLGSIDLFAAHEISDNLDVLTELVFEAPGGDMIVDLERAEVGYAVFGDLLNMRMGRFHTPVGEYSSLYHHGRLFESAVGRPLILEFEDEGGLVPAHVVGLWGRGTWSAPVGKLKYNLAVGNGHSLDMDNAELKLNMTSDDNRNKVVMGSLVFEPGGPLEGLGVGASFIKGKVFGYTVATGTAAPTLEIDQLITGANIYYLKAPVELMAEFYALADRNMTDGAHPRASAIGYFVQGSYEFKAAYRPYLRFEEVRPKNDAYANALIGANNIKRVTCGFRYNFNVQSALKLEVLFESRGAVKDVPILAFQWAYGF